MKNTKEKQRMDSGRRNTQYYYKTRFEGMESIEIKVIDNPILTLEEK